MVFLKKIDIIWDVLSASEKFISFRDLITWPVLTEIISNFNVPVA